jgi:hypothetical protein
MRSSCKDSFVLPMLGKRSRTLLQCKKRELNTNKTNVGESRMTLYRKSDCGILSDQIVPVDSLYV